MSRDWLFQTRAHTTCAVALAQVLVSGSALSQTALATSDPKAHDPLLVADAQSDPRISNVSLFSYLQQPDVDTDGKPKESDSAILAGYDDHFFIETADGDYRIELSGQVQVRLTASHRDMAPTDEERNPVSLQNRRTKLKLKGNLGGKDLGYAISGAFDREGGAFTLEDAYVSYDIGDGFSGRVGSFRSPLLREESVSSKQQLLVERSLVARRFSQDRTVGAAGRIQNKNTRFDVAIMDPTTSGTTMNGWLISARGELLIDGSWKRLKGFTSFPGNKPASMVGAGVLLSDVSMPGAPDQSMLRWTVDYSAEFGGSNLFVAIVGNQDDREDRAKRDQFGVVAQSGLFVSDDTELFAQYVFGTADNADTDLSVVTAGVNHYFDGHRIKLTADVGFGLNPIDSFWDSSGAGWNEDTGSSGQAVARVQLQFLF